MAQNFAQLAVNKVKQVASSLGKVVQQASNFQQASSKAFLNPGYAVGKTVSNSLFPEGKKVLQQLSTPEGQSQFQAEPANDFRSNVRQYVGNRYIAPVAQVPHNLSQTFGKNKTPVERGLGALGVLGGTVAMIPDPIGDLAMPAYDYLKGVTAAQQQGQGTLQSYKTGVKSLTGQQYTGLGTASGATGTTEGALNLAELPLIIFAGGRITKNKQLDIAVKRSQPIIESTVLAIEQYKTFRPEEQIKLFTQVQELAKEFIPQVLNSKEMKKLSTVNPGEWLKRMGTFLENRVVVANHPEINIGLKTQAIKRLDDTPPTKGGGSKLSQEAPTKTTGMKTKKPGLNDVLEESSQKLQEVQRKTPTGVITEEQSLPNIINSSVNDVKSKVNIIDLGRTPEYVLEKIGLKNEATGLRNAYDAYLKELPIEIDKITKWSKEVPAESNKRIFQFLDGKPIELAPIEAKVAGEIKAYLADWADRLKLPQEKRISNYITHIFEKGLIQKEFDPEVAKIIDQNIAGSVYDPFTLERLGKLGYKEDVWAALDAYVKRGTRKVNLDPALEQLKKSANSLPIESYKYVKDYVDQVNMRPLHIETLIDNFIKSTPIGYSQGQRPFTALSRKARQMVYRGTLGLNVGSALKNLTQGVNTYAKLGEKYTLVGYKDLFKNFRSSELKDVGVLSNELIQDRGISAVKQFSQKFDAALFSLFELAEKINRGSAYYGAKAKALDQGATEEVAIQFAKRIVRETQFAFGSIDTPAVLQSDIAKTLLQFQSFNIKQAEFLGKLITDKDYAGAVRWALASVGVVFTVGKALNMKLQDLIPSIRVGGSPLFTLGKDVISAATGGRDQYGNTPKLKSRIKKIGNDLVPLIPGGVQVKKLLKGKIVSGELPSLTRTASAAAAPSLTAALTPTQKAAIDEQVKELTAKQKEILEKKGVDLPFFGQVGGLTESQRNQQYNALQAQIDELKQPEKQAKILDKVSEVSALPSSTSYEQLQKKKEAYSLADDILKLPIADQAQAFNALGITADDATYYQVAKGTNDLKTAYINDAIAGIDTKNRGDLLNYLVSQRKVVNGDMVLADGVITDLSNRDIISDAEAKMLKNLKIVDGKPITKLSGRGKKTTLKKISLPTTSKIKPFSMKSLLGKTKKLKIKKTKFRKKL